MLRHALAITLLCSAPAAAMAETSVSGQAVLLAQNGKAAPRPVAKPAEKPADSHRQGEQKTEAPAAGKTEESRPEEAAGKYDQDSTNAPERRPECMWTGQRIVSLLSRDDINTAREHMNFYDRFGCPKDHITVAFRCSIRQAERQPQQTDISARVYGCWMSPDLGESEPTPTAAPQDGQPAAPETPPEQPKQ